MLHDAFHVWEALFMWDEAGLVTPGEDPGSMSSRALSKDPLHCAPFKYPSALARVLFFICVCL